MSYKVLGETKCPTCDKAQATTAALVCDGPCGRQVTIPAAELSLWTRIQAHNGHVTVWLDVCTGCVPSLIAEKLGDQGRRMLQDRRA